MKKNHQIFATPEMHTKQYSGRVSAICVCVSRDQMWKHVLFTALFVFWTLSETHPFTRVSRRRYLLTQRFSTLNCFAPCLSIHFSRQAAAAKRAEERAQAERERAKAEAIARAASAKVYQFRGMISACFMPHMGAYVELEAQQTRQLLGRAQQQVFIFNHILPFGCLVRFCFYISMFHFLHKTSSVPFLSSHVEIKSSCSGSLWLCCNCILL